MSENYPTFDERKIMTQEELKAKADELLAELFIKNGGSDNCELELKIMALLCTASQKAGYQAGYEDAWEARSQV
tara:strand:- start:1895 stop:2116 length:222 start_codon:yes stop_codon:yes gene_type:complete